MMIVVAAVTVLVLAAMTVLLFRTWWAPAIALSARGLGTATVVAYSVRRASKTGDKPHPVTEARMDEERDELTPSQNRPEQAREGLRGLLDAKRAAAVTSSAVPLTLNYGRVDLGVFRATRAFEDGAEP